MSFHFHPANFRTAHGLMAHTPLGRKRSCRALARSLFALCLLLLLGNIGVQAASLSEYRSRIQQALAELEDLWESEEDYDAAPDRERTMVVLEKVGKLLPTEETIEWAGGRVRVNNAWLAEELKNYRQLAPDDSQREDILLRMTGRLRALEDRLNETDARGGSFGLDKEGQKPRLEAILRREEYSDKPPEKGALARLWERIKEWWASLLPTRNPLQPGQSWLSFLVTLLIFAAAGGLIAYGIIKLIPFFQRGKGAQRRLAKRGPRFVLGERLAPEQNAASLLHEAEELARRGELRAAIRKGYVALLCELGERKVLSLAQHKTNRDYLRAVREKRPLLNEMQKLTASFENHWYGFVPATPNDWAAFRSGYQQTVKTATLLSDK